jgi:hypothetical protein
MTPIEPVVTIPAPVHHARTRLPWLLCALVMTASGAYASALYTQDEEMDQVEAERARLYAALDRCIDKRAATFPFEMSDGWWIFNCKAVPTEERG